MTAGIASRRSRCQGSINDFFREKRDGRDRTRLSGRCPGGGFHAIRGRTLLHRVVGLARRRSRQDREPADRRPRPAAAARQARQRPLVFPPVQREQEIADAESEIDAWDLKNTTTSDTKK